MLFLLARQKHLWQWLSLATIAGVVLMHVFVWPFTWNGGGGPVGSRYFLPFYALFLVLIPATAGIGAALMAFRRRCALHGAARDEPVLCLAEAGHTHQIRSACGCCPLELTLLHDLPVAQDRDRMRKVIGPPNPSPQTFAYFLDDNAFMPEETTPSSNDWWFWVKGHAKAEVVLRAPVASLGGDNWVTKNIARLNIEIAERRRYKTA